MSNYCSTLESPQTDNSVIPGRMEVRVFRSDGELEAIRDLWTSLQAHPNIDYEYYQLIHRSRRQIIRPHVVVAYRAGVPETLVIGRIEQVKISVGIGYAKLASLSAKRLTLIHGGVLGNCSSENCQAIFESIERALRDGEADLATLSYLSTDCPLVRHAIEKRNLLSRQQPLLTQSHRVMSLPMRSDELYERFSVKVRKNLKWQMRKLEKDHNGELAIRCFSTCAELDSMFRDIEAVARNTYQRGLGAGFEDNPEMRARMELLAQQDQLRAYILYIHQQPSAFWVGSVYRNVLHSNFMGFDRTYARYSPGMYLILRVLEQLCNSAPNPAVRSIDFGLGDAQYKKLLSDLEWTEASISVFAPSLRGLRLMLLQTPLAILNNFSQRILAQAGLLQKVKTLWRGRLPQHSL